MRIAQVVSKLLVCFVKEKNNLKVSACFFENTINTNSKDCTQSHIRISVLLLNVLLLRFYLLSPFPFLTLLHFLIFFSFFILLCCIVRLLFLSVPLPFLSLPLPLYSTPFSSFFQNHKRSLSLCSLSPTCLWHHISYSSPLSLILLIFVIFLFFSRIFYPFF
jgi:hypothetical protein